MLEHEAAGFRAIDFRTGDVGRQQVGGELNAVELGFDTFCQLLDGLGLGQAGSAFDQHVAIGKQGNEQTFDQLFLAKDLR